MTVTGFGGLATTAIDSLVSGQGFIGAAQAVASQTASKVLSSFTGGGGTLGAASAVAAVAGGDVGAALSGAGALATSIPGLGVGGAAPAAEAAAAVASWNFVVAPEDISWDSQVATQRVDIFGTNSPPVTVGSKGMRNLNLGNALLEGFTRGRTVEGRVASLENLMKFTLNASGGFVNVPVYNVLANKKKYGDANGTEGGYFVISDVKVKETMRDLDGKSTRAFAEVSLVQVPYYQVDTGRDQASKALSAASATGLQGGPTATATAPGSVTAPASGQAVPPPAPPPATPRPIPLDVQPYTGP